MRGSFGYLRVIFWRVYSLLKLHAYTYIYQSYRNAKIYVLKELDDEDTRRITSKCIFLFAQRIYYAWAGGDTKLFTCGSNAIMMHKVYAARRHSLFFCRFVYARLIIKLATFFSHFTLLLSPLSCWNAKRLILYIVYPCIKRSYIRVSFKWGVRGNKTAYKILLLHFFLVSTFF